MTIINLFENENINVDIHDIEIQCSTLKWKTNLNLCEMEKIINILRTNRFFVKEVKDPVSTATSKTSVAISLDLNSIVKQVKVNYMEVYCLVRMVFDTVWVVYRTDKQWELWNQAKEREQRGEERKIEEFQHIEKKIADLLLLAEKSFENGDYDRAIEFYKQRVTQAERFKDSRYVYGAVCDLNICYFRIPDIERSIEYFKTSNRDINWSVFADYHIDNHVYFMRIMNEGMKISEYKDRLYRDMCLYLQKKELFELAIDYCKQAIELNLDDFTKSGFEGRLKRLEKKLSQK